MKVGHVGLAARRWLWLLGAALVAFTIVLAVLDERMREAGGPGIVAFELAASEERTQEIVSEWGADGRDAARASLWLDFGYLALYGSFLAVAVAATRDTAVRRGRRGFAGPAQVVLLPVAAAGFDAMENVALLLILGEHGGWLAPPLAAAFATAKFALLATSLLYILVNLLARASAAVRRG